MHHEIDPGDVEPLDRAGALDAIRPLANLPVFFKLTGRRVAVAGDGEGAAWKAELLAAAGAAVDAYCAEPGARLIEAAERHPSISIVRRAWTEADLEGAAIAVADVETEEAPAFRAAARRAGAPVNIIDKPEFCDFAFGGIVNRSPLVIGISTDGGAPVFGQALRARIEALMPPAFAAWAETAKAWRRDLAALDLGFRRRRAFWERFAALALADAGRAPTDEDRRRLLEATAREGAVGEKGQIVLVGAGPGDPELLTMKAVRALQSADVVLFDDLVSPGVLEMARREARRISVGKRGHLPSVGQQELSALMVSLAQSGKRVVRLKGGDPAIFGRSNEEIEAARAAGIACSIIPGVTAALAAAASLGVSLSERARARRVQFVTAHSKEGELPEGLEWRALADPDVTTGVYMGVRTLPPLAARLIAEGLDPDTPAVMVESVSTRRERAIAGTIGDLAEKIAAAAPTGPCVMLYGRALDRADIFLAGRPLASPETAP